MHSSNMRALGVYHRVAYGLCKHPKPPLPRLTHDPSDHAAEHVKNMKVHDKLAHTDSQVVHEQAARRKK